MENEHNEVFCLSLPCGWFYSVADNEINCGPGTSCTSKLHEADESTFHDAVLMEATEKIRKILDEIPENDEGRKPSFIHTVRGTMLVWVRHGSGEATGSSDPTSSEMSTGRNVITADDDEAVIAEALKLKNWK